MNGYHRNAERVSSGISNCAEILSLIEQGMIDTTPLITHRYSLEEIEEAYRMFENREEGVIKIAVKCSK